MLPHKNHRRALNLLAKLSIVSVLLTLVVAGSIRPAVADSDNGERRPNDHRDSDILYAGDIASNTVRRFNAETGSRISGGSSSGVFVQSGSGGLVGPMGLLAKSGKLIVVNQNVDLPKPGEILRYKLNDGAVDGALVPFSNDHAPFAPRGIVILRGIIYVATLILATHRAGWSRLTKRAETSFASSPPPMGLHIPSILAEW